MCILKRVSFLFLVVNSLLNKRKTIETLIKPKQNIQTFVDVFFENIIKISPPYLLNMNIAAHRRKLIHSAELLNIYNLYIYILKNKKMKEESTGFEHDLQNRTKC